jgi:hypothetical protein
MLSSFGTAACRGLGLSTTAPVWIVGSRAAGEAVAEAEPVRAVEAMWNGSPLGTVSGVPPQAPMASMLTTTVGHSLECSPRRPRTAISIFIQAISGR